MSIKSFPIQYNGFFIFDTMSLIRYSKKNFKGRIVAYLKPFLTSNRRVIDFKTLKKLELMSLDFLYDSQNKMQPCLKLLKRSNCATKLALHHLIREDNDLYITYLMLKRYKGLTCLELNTINRSEKITDRGLFWLKKILKLTKHIQSLTYSGLRQNMSETAICRTFSILPRLEFLKKITLEICLTWNFIRAFDLMCSLLALCPNLKSTTLNIKYYDTVYDDTFKFLFHPLMKIKYLREVSIYLGVYTYKVNSPLSAIRPLSEFLENSQFLEVFSIDMRLEIVLPLIFPLDKAKNLRKLVLYLRESKGLLDDNFSRLTTSIKQCKKLQEFSLNISRCANLTDYSIRRLCEALINIPELKNLNLIIGDKIGKAATFTPRIIQYISDALSKTNKLLDLELNLSNLLKITDIEIELLLQAISKNSGLKDLKLDFSACKIGSKAFQTLSRSIGKLSNLETLEFDLYTCAGIGTDFLEYLKNMLTSEGNNMKNLQKIMVNLTGTAVQKEETAAYQLFVKQMCPKCYLSLYIR